MHCDKIVPRSCTFFDYYFSFPAEWDREEYICLAGIWLSHGESVSWVTLEYGSTLYINCFPFRFNEDDNWLSKFNDPVIIRTQTSDHYIEITTDEEIVDFTVTFQWCAVHVPPETSRKYQLISRTYALDMENVKGVACSLNDEATMFHNRLIQVHTDEYQFLSVDELLIKPVNDYDEVIYTMVSLNTVCIHGPPGARFIVCTQKPSTVPLIFATWSFIVN